ncbi:hypothetical protein CEXT_660551 [Caerostris extrusa]|uniref:Uncharacterized protein n=1 Tax=Caerostris extrusa TaxID=172846 RepID=A0AAV4XPG3_CAEEX|nr:hypothetical protein CEXT_660551 [Caerostris extrusa]
MCFTTFTEYGKDSKKGKLVTRQIKRNLECRKPICNMLIERHKKKGFCFHRILTNDKHLLMMKMDISRELSKQKLLVKQVHHCQSEKFIVSKLCFVWYQKCVIHYQLLKQSETLGTEMALSRNYYN